MASLRPKIDGLEGMYMVGQDVATARMGWSFELGVDDKHDDCWLWLYGSGSLRS